MNIRNASLVVALMSLGVISTKPVEAKPVESEALRQTMRGFLCIDTCAKSIQLVGIVVDKSEDEKKIEAEEAKREAAEKVTTQRNVVARNAPQRAETGLPGYSCVLYVEAKTGVNPGVIGVARNFPTNSQTPAVGAIVKTSESRAGHVSIISDIQDGYLILDEANYTPGRITIGRKLAIDSPVILGYFR